VASSLGFGPISGRIRSSATTVIIQFFSSAGSSLAGRKRALGSPETLINILPLSLRGCRIIASIKLRKIGAAALVMPGSALSISPSRSTCPHTASVLVRGMSARLPGCQQKH